MIRVLRLMLNSGHNSSMVRIFKYFLAIFFFVVFAVFLTGLIIGRYYQDKVNQLMIAEINKHLLTEVRVEEVSFSVLRKFPQGSVELRNVLVKVPEGYKNDGTEGIDSDTLFTAQNLFLQFNIKDIFRGDYIITRIHALKGVFYPAVNSDAQENFRFWKASETADDGFHIDLQDIRLNNYRLKYGNVNKEIYFDSDLRRLEMSGNFNRSSFGLSGRAVFNNRKFRHQGLEIAGNQEVSVNAVLDVDNDMFVIEKGSIELSGIKFEAAGDYQNGTPGRINMNLTGHNLDIATAIPFLPADTRESLELYNFKGEIDFEASISGELSKSISPSVVASFYTENGEIIREDTGVRLTGINLSGYYSNGSLRNSQSSTISISSFSSVLGQGSIRGNGSISDLSNPVVDFDIDASFFLEETARFYKPENIDQMAGKINTAFSVRGPLQTPVKWDIEEIRRMDLEGMMEIENGMLQITEGKYIATEIGGKLNFGSVLRTSGLSFNIGSDHFLIRGEIINGLPWLLDTGNPISITGSLYSKSLNLDNYINTASAGQPGTDVSRPLLLPSDLELNLDFLIEDLNFRKFSSGAFRGKLSYKPRMVVLNAVDFDALEGKLSGNGVIVQRINGDFVVQSQLQLEKVDIQKMFLTFNNFKQTFIHGDNLKGSITGNIGFISEWNQDLQLKEDKIVADSRIEIRDGELIGFEPMLGLARFIDVEELQHIRFSTLNNEIFIRDRVVTIPQMDIYSSAFDISGSGNHRFDGYFDYHLRVLLSDVLFGKASRSKPENQEFGIVEDDGLGRTSLYLLVSGTSGNYKVSYDHLAVRDKIRENITSERKKLRQLFHEEFGWFTPDSSAVSGPRTETGDSSGSGFRIIWDEDDKKVDPVTGPDPPVQNNREPRERRFQIIWDEKENPSNNSGSEYP